MTTMVLYNAIRWTMNNPLKSFVMALMFSAGGGWLIDRNRTLQNEAESLVPCTTDSLSKFVPADSPAYQTIKLKLLRECMDADKVSSFLIELHAKTYLTDFCFSLPQYERSCGEALSKIKKITGATQKKMDPKRSKIELIPEGGYGITDAKNTIATAGISYCVGVAITSPHSSDVLLAHINAENSLAHNEYLKKRFEDPFEGIRNFVKNEQLSWQATIASGSPRSLAYVMTVLEKMGLNNIEGYCEPAWTTPGFSLNNGNIMIKDGKALFIENAEDFKSLIPISDARMRYFLNPNTKITPEVLKYAQ